MTTTISLAPLLERFFIQRLMQQRQASPHTISSYRDTFRQFLTFVQQQLHQPPSRLNFEQIDAPLIVAFLLAQKRFIEGIQNGINPILDIKLCGMLIGDSVGCSLSKTLDGIICSSTSRLTSNHQVYQ